MSGIPLVAPPTSPTPGLWLRVNLEPNAVASGSQPLKGLIIGPKNASGGDMTAGTEIRAITTQDGIETAAGIGSLPALAYKRIRSKYPNATIDLVCPAVSGGATATGKFAGGAAVTEDMSIAFYIMGREIIVPWLYGVAAADFHTLAVSYINRYSSELFCTASVSTGILLTAKGPGPAGNDIALRYKILEGSGGTITTTAFTGGTTEIDIATALATVAGREYDFILVCLSNADVENSSGNFADLADAIEDLETGPAAKLQQGIVGHTGTRTAALAVSAVINRQPMEIINLEGAESLPCEIGGDEMGSRMIGRALLYSANRIGEEMDVYGSADPVGDNPEVTESDAALLAGLSVGGYKEDGTPYLIRAVTTYVETATGSAVLPTDCNEIDAMYEVGKDLRAKIPVEFAGAKIQRDATEPEDEPPEGVVEERDVKAFIAATIRNFWIPKGVIDGAHFEEKVAAGELLVEVNDVDETQVDCFIPLKPTKNLAKFSVYVQKDG